MYVAVRYGHQKYAISYLAIVKVRGGLPQWFFHTKRVHRCYK